MNGCTLSKNKKKFRDISRSVEENKIIHEIFRVISRFPRYISCYISENRCPLGQSVSADPLYTVQYGWLSQLMCRCGRVEEEEAVDYASSAIFIVFWLFLLPAELSFWPFR